MGIQIENEFVVPAPLDRVWAHLLDVERIAPCMPGAQLTEIVDDRNWKGKVNIKLGPVSLSFAGTVTMQERDDDAHRVVLKASGMEQKGKGAANALVTAWAEPDGDNTRVKFQQDLTISGAVAQFSRGMMQDVSAKLTQQFADCLKANMSAEPEPSSESSGGDGEAPTTPKAPTAGPPAAQAKPVGGIRLGLWALWRAIVRFFKRLFGRGPKPTG